MDRNEIILRLKSCWRLKLALSVWVGTGFTAIYLLIQRYPLLPVTQVRSTWVDRAIPFMPGTVYLYESLWAMVPIGLWLIRAKTDLTRYSRGFFLISTVCFSFFILFPTSIPRPKDLDGVNSVYRALMQIDKDPNAFPSLHVALAVFAGACGHRLSIGWRRHKTIAWFIWIWALGIIASTLLTKQHAIVDVFGGALVGSIGFWSGRIRSGSDESI